MGKASDAARGFFVELKKAAEPAPLYLLFGAEAFLLQMALDEVTRAVLPKGPNDFNMDVFYGKDADPHRIVGSCETLVLFGGRRLVLVKEIHRMGSAGLEALARYLDDPSPMATLVCHGLTQDKALSKQTGFYRKAKKVGVVQEFEALREWEVGTFLRRQAKSRGLQLSEVAEQALIQAVGSDLASLDGALEKVDLYLGPGEKVRQVDEESLREVVAMTRSLEVFEFTDALAERRLARSLHLLVEMLEQGQNGIGINRMVSRQLRQIWQVKAAMLRGLGKNDIVKVAGVSPYFVDRLQGYARRFSEGQLRRGLHATLETDRRLKSSRLKERVILEEMVVAICG